jgi:hypothetical protein
VALEVKNLLGGAELLTVCYETGAYAIFTIIGTKVWSIYRPVLAEAGLWLSWMWIGTERGLVTGGPGTLTGILR